MRQKACFIQAHQLSYCFDGAQTRLIHPTDISIHKGITCLIGRNGSGKSVLAKLLAKHLQPTQGSIKQYGTVSYLSQGLEPYIETVDSYLNYKHWKEAYNRLQNNQTIEKDFDTLEQRWDFEANVLQALSDFGFSHEILSKPMHCLSGGEQTKIRLIHLGLQKPSIVILDEPSNHLDKQGREQLIHWMRQQSCVILITHHSQLLQVGDTILEIDHGHIQHIQAGWSVYLQTKHQQKLAIERQEKNLKKDIKLEKQKQIEQHKKQAKIAKQGQKRSKETNQCKLVTNHLKSVAQKTQSRQDKSRQQSIQQTSKSLQELQRTKNNIEPLHFYCESQQQYSGVVLQLHNVSFDNLCFEPLSMQISPSMKVAVTGSNGSGKSRLLKAIAFEKQSYLGEITRRGLTVYLDQHFSLLKKEESVLDNFERLNPHLDQAHYRTLLAQLRINKNNVTLPVGHLSGGEQLKIALAAILSQPKAPAVLLLDEPDNHLDLESKTDLERLLSVYSGALMVVSHDDGFLQNIGVTDTVFLDK